MVHRCQVWHLHSLGCLLCPGLRSGGNSEGAAVCRMVLALPGRGQKRAESKYHGDVEVSSACVWSRLSLSGFCAAIQSQLFDPTAWANLFQRSGAKYVVLTSKHHDGFALWPSEQASKTWGRPWNSAEIGPHRDLVGDLSTAVRAKGLKMGLYYSLYEWCNPLWLTDKPKYVSQHMIPQFKDVVTRYKPSIIFSDGEWDLLPRLANSGTPRLVVQ